MTILMRKIQKQILLTVLCKFLFRLLNLCEVNLMLRVFLNRYEKDKPLEASLLLATGSVDPYAYLYNVGGPEVIKSLNEIIKKIQIMQRHICK